MSRLTAGSAWLVAQLIPSPLIVTGKDHVGGGVRWQLTPLSYSFGISARPFTLLGAARMIPIHFGTFINSDDAPAIAPTPSGKTWPNAAQRHPSLHSKHLIPK
jgi:hypothetical protein